MTLSADSDAIAAAEWREKVLELAGVLGDDFPDDIDERELPVVAQHSI